VCSRLVEKYSRPAILMQIRPEAEDSPHAGEVVAHGSGRSIRGFSLHGALAKCSHLLEKFGGHDMAAGLRVREAILPEFVAAFTGIANRDISVDALSPELAFDCEASAAELTRDAVQQLRHLGPFGRDNPEPLILLRGLTIAARPEPLGAAAKHLAIRVRQNGRMLRTLAWGWGEHREKLVEGRHIDALVEPKLSTWHGMTSIEPTLRDLVVLP
jgi:single-stranded-DNA-specific exonuclease